MNIQKKPLNAGQTFSQPAVTKINTVFLKMAKMPLKIYDCAGDLCSSCVCLSKSIWITVQRHCYYLAVCCLLPQCVLYWCSGMLSG